MKYQLVIQFSEAYGFDFLADVEDRLETYLEEGVVDGHDFGNDEMNIFILTNDPEKSFIQIKTIVTSKEMTSARIAYRKVLSDDFKIVWPETLQSFSVS